MKRRSKTELRVLKEAPLTDEQQMLVADHYNDALRIGIAWKSNVLYDDEKETIAINALVWAAKTFDPNHINKVYSHILKRKAGRFTFNSWLYVCLRNRLMTYGRHITKKKTAEGIFVTKIELLKKRIPLEKILYESVLNQKYAESGGVNVFENLLKVPDTINSLEYKELIQLIHNQLNEKQKTILNYLLKNYSFEEVGIKFGVSRQCIDHYMHEIRTIVANIIKEYK